MSFIAFLIRFCFWNFASQPLQSRNKFIPAKLNDLQLRRFTVVKFPQRCCRTFADFHFLHEIVAQHGAKSLAVVVEVFLQQRHDAVIPDEPQVFRVGMSVAL